MLKHRLISGLSLAFALIAAILWAPWYVLVGVLWLMMVASQREFVGLMVPDGLPGGVRRLTLGLGVVLLAALFVDTRPGETSALTLWVLVGGLWALLLWTMASKRDTAVRECAGLVLSLLYVPLCMGLLTHVVWGGYGMDVVAWPEVPLAARVRVLYLLWVVKVSDVGAYAFGMTLGRHRMCPRLSPAKTWEGFAGGLIGGMLASLIAVRLGAPFEVLTYSPLHAVGLGLVLAVVGVAGDLSESMFKRAAGVKDSGQGFPGMGGILDMVDSVLPAAPAMLLYMRLTGAA